MRKPLLAGNWKMNKNIGESVVLAKELVNLVRDVSDREVLICPTFPALHQVSEAIKGTNVKLGAQNLFWEDSGAYTGEISGPLLLGCECTHVIIGHSERRQYFGETDETVNKRLMAALKHGLIPIVCVGETLSERENNETFKIIERQIKEGLKGVSVISYKLLVIAYEPVWAIGTGKTATPDQAEEIHHFIRQLLPAEARESVRILYGGSVKPDNAKELMGKENIDGALVGGASLKAQDFAAIVKY